MNPKIHTLLGVQIHDQSDQEFESRVTTWLQDASGKVIVTPNAEMLLRARKNSRYKSLLNQADLSIADSVSIRYATAALTDEYLKHRRPGVDALKVIAVLAATQNKRLMLLGGDSESAVVAAQALKRNIKELDVIGIDPGHLQYNKNAVTISQTLVESLERMEADIVAVALGMEKQEAFMHQMKQLLPNVKVWIGVGGALEMISGQKQRAPWWLSNVGMEWAWRLIIEPKRIPRILKAAVVFPLVVAGATIKQKRFSKAVPRVITEISRQFRNV